MDIIPNLIVEKLRIMHFQYDIVVTSSLKENDWHKRENFVRGLEFLVHFQIGLGFRVIGVFSW